MTVQVELTRRLCTWNIKLLLFLLYHYKMYYCTISHFPITFHKAFVYIEFYTISFSVTILAIVEKFTVCTHYFVLIIKVQE